MLTFKELDLEKFPKNKISRSWIHVINNGIGEPIRIPILVAKGKKNGQTIGLTAAVHGNELNGIPVIQNLFSCLDTEELKGNIVGVFPINVPGVLLGRRQFNDGVDLNKIAPGKLNGNESAVFVYRVIEKIVRKFDYLVDLHTASFGRRNSFYIRADMSDKVTARMATLLGPDIILNNPPRGSTLRGSAAALGIKSITIELKDPNLFQNEVIQEATIGLTNVLCDLGFLPGQAICPIHETILCSDSYWKYTDEGGILTVTPKIGNYIKAGEKIAEVKSIFGDIIKEYHSEDNGIVIGKSVNPINQTGSRIIHLGLSPKVILCEL